MNDREYDAMFAAEDRHWWYRTTHAFIEEIVQREHARKGPLALFDAGCGTGGLLARLARLGTASGCDASPLALTRCRQRGLDAPFQADLLTIDLPPDSIDVITCIDVLCHHWIKDEVDVLKRFAAGLRPGGLLILQQPAFECLRGAHDLAVHTRTRVRRPQMRRWIESAGLTVERLTYRYAPLFPAIWLARVFSRSRTTGESDVTIPHPLTNAVLGAVGALDNAWLRVANDPFGSSLVALARKPARG
jgi:SAM-dependent methyltransferase